MIRKKKKTDKKSSGKGAVELPNLEFKPKASDSNAAQGILIACRAMEQFPAAVILVAQAIKNRADQIMLDYSQQGVAVRFRVDGLWENMPPLDRPTCDGMLVIFKRMCSLNPNDRRNRQQGVLPVKYRADDWILHLLTQGVPSGERVLIRIEPKKAVLKTLADLGMREKMQETFRSLINSDDALFLFSAGPSQGLPTLWRVGLESADRFVRDFHSIEDVNLGDPELINITKHTYDSSANESPMTLLKSLLLKQPDVLVFPDFHSEEVVKLICGEIKGEHRYAISRVQAGSAVEALLKFITTYKGAARELLDVTCGVINQRLVRRLCVDCRQAFQPSPQLLKKLGIPPGRVKVLYQPFIPPPPEQRVDQNGKPIEIEICKKCGGRGYFGRAGLFELLTVNDVVKKAILSNPKPENVLAVAKQQGFLTFQEEGVLAVATGLTSLQEVQRVLSPKKR